MDRFNNWDTKKNADYEYIDDIIREHFEIGGVSVFLHKYIGVIDQGNQSDPSQPGATQTPTKGVNEIQDLFFQENRDRAYDPYVYELKAIYNMLDTDFNVFQFGLQLESDTYFLSFHLTEVVEQIGRKLMTGDVLEMLHMRDDALLDDNAPAINKFYQVTDVNRASVGWSVTWRPHLLRVKISPITDSQQFNQILNMPASDQVGGDGLEGTGVPGLLGEQGYDSDQATGGNIANTPETTVKDLISDFRTKISISEALVQEAEYLLPYRNYDASNLYIVPGSTRRQANAWIYAGQGLPPNSAIPATSGTSFPENPHEGDYFLLLPEPNAIVDVGTGHPLLYQSFNNLWILQEVDYGMKWQSAHRILASFLNNNNFTSIQGTSFPTKQPIRTLLRPDSIKPVPNNRVQRKLT